MKKIGKTTKEEQKRLKARIKELEKSIEDNQKIVDDILEYSSKTYMGAGGAKQTISEVVYGCQLAIKYHENDLKDLKKLIK